ncbi:dihydroorotate dehydrogenase [Methanothermobacter sp. EMTCatA1]|jgi:dihydroorotate dehydrogenase (NAD+) catalytic subunit|uniref:dihydroorotate dehydrogenase n=1 Tax=Methanothermobacter sp. EMTCatA1 TaxID=2017966 RepID=UPI000B5FF6B1|nr:dihydroorotate dehydrogenase [Methanothermobacter sp. EMTCatA1]MDK2874329.1 dihydroorotate dehydrogenase catalytic subunit [Methanothermobacter sp.]BAZ99229.1 Dihydroorotate dehydrogenase B (NAD(+)), catalytic subunit [Methanothermobacter sp. EMTCatA1]
MLETSICNIELRNPTILAAGVMGSMASSLNRIYRAGAGAVVTKSFSLRPNPGYRNPTTVEVTGGVINAIGLSNPGVEAFREELKLVDEEVPLIASVYGASPEEFASAAASVEEYADMIELNVSCPHAMAGCGASIGQDPELTFRVVSAVKDAVDVPVSTKLTPNVTDIVEIAGSAEEAGSDALTLINSLGPGMKIDIKTARPILSNAFGGMSGPAIKPVAVRCVYDVYRSVDIPIMGVGGVRDFQDAVEFLFAGARAVQVGTAIMYDGPEVFMKICRGLEAFMMAEGFSSVDEMVGLAHD